MADETNNRYLVGNYPPVKNVPSRTQVSLLTYDYSSSAGLQRKSAHERAFISFSYGGRWIEDFGLIVVFDGDEGLNRPLSAEIEDLTTSYEILNGQMFWGSRYKENTLSLRLATDNMTQQQLNDFSSWFCGGVTRELILAEHPNRAILARIAEAPTIQMVPTTERHHWTVGDVTYNTATAFYRGTIGLSFVMDEPFWYSKTNMLGYKDTNTDVWKDVITNSRGQEVSIYKDISALRTIIEDGVPGGEMMCQNIMVGNQESIKFIFNYRVTEGGFALPATLTQNNSQAFTFGAILKENEAKYSVNKNTPVYLYYGGTAPSLPTISFKFTPHISTAVSTKDYIDFPQNSFTVPKTPYNTLTLSSAHTTSYLKFTTPSAMTAYNQAIKIMKTATPSAGIVEWKHLFREGIKHTEIRKKAIAALPTSGSINSNTVISNFKIACDNLLKKECILTINCKTGEATYTYYLNSGTATEIANAGDAIYFNDLHFSEQNHYDAKGRIQQAVSNPEYSYKLTFDSTNTLSDLQVTYKFMYY